MQPRRMILVCQNERAAGKESCRPSGGDALLAAFKLALKERGLKGALRAVGTSCLGQCAGGPHCVVWPEGVWYRGLQAADVAEIVEQHLVGGRPVERLRAPAPPPESLQAE
ncbi:MAG: (2Fe-2S) ferredoxin domain-containing protein [Planctomycetota bacterium]|nr:MAG: (2Fe-2S) ferredoxin domain-containing protein [Planctomycetota bacterium]